MCLHYWVYMNYTRLSFPSMRGNLSCSRSLRWVEDLFWKRNKAREKAATSMVGHISIQEGWYLMKEWLLQLLNYRSALGFSLSLPKLFIPSSADPERLGSTYKARTLGNVHLLHCISVSSFYIPRTKQDLAIGPYNLPAQSSECKMNPFLFFFLILNPH